ncbi:Flagellar biosynthetic protein FliQ [Candidatus Bealeia paramacronuclearis]|uniref:Flagellar biosynthetic protein FliQ n=1 Tax=Candidatus Bealeia paramacronuclearis TaxID=1921001 RepID=A0ABZ2C0C7_9PROT|nr:Flagellar biosynthetic protein FliQ [Candidatus Bealeia paramacronuclearis]
MTGAEVIDIAREGVLVMLKLGLPLMLVALIVGFIISLIQALTQIQEMTLSFVPKILAIFVAFILLLPFMGMTMENFGNEIFQRIAGIESGS